MKLPSPPLLVVTDRSQARRSLDEILSDAFAAGCRWASIREKDLPADEQVALARRLLPLARRHGAMLTLHGAAQLAVRAEADGVHLPARSDAKAAREVLGSGALIGLSVHTIEEAVAADAGVVDYLIAGPAYETASKPGYGPFLEMQGIAAICAATTVPVIAIGGVTPRVVPELMIAGAAGVAVMGGAMRAEDAGKMVRELSTAMADG